VIHRDLKPGNVMVGAFGEVQVMDWGLAKVLGDGRPAERDGRPDPTPGTAIRTPRRAESDATAAGAVMGTPAFMAPEQARGLVDEVDARTDVFGLGGILCALLTGVPPYVGESRLSVELMAASADVAAAFARLDASGADPDLVALCKRCLAPHKGERPADGGAVAAAVAGWRAAADERTRKAEKEAAAATVRAAEERKRRRVQLALAATAAGLVVVAGLLVNRVAGERARADARRGYEDQLARLTDDPTDLAAAGGHLDSLRPHLTAGEWDRARRLLIDRYTDRLLAALARPDAGSAEVDRARAGLRSLRDRFPDDDHAPLAAAIDRKAAEPLREFELVAPFADREALLPGGGVRVDGAALAGTKGGDLLPGRIPSGRAVSVLEAEVAGYDPGDGRSVGVALDSDSGGYRLLLRPRPGAGEPTAQAVLLRGDTPLRSADLSADDLRRPVALRLERDGTEVRAEAGAAVRLTYRDVFGTARPSAGTFGLVLPPGPARLARLAGWHRPAAADPSPAVRADQLFLAGGYNPAGAAYRQLMAVAPNREREFRYKLGVCCLGLRQEAEATAEFERLAAGPADD
jgi:hypothetical protein